MINIGLVRLLLENGHKADHGAVKSLIKRFACGATSDRRKFLCCVLIDVIFRGRLRETLKS